MRITRWILLAALVVFTASAAVADGVDPVFRLTKSPLSTPVTNGTFPFNAVNTGNTTVDFTLDYINQSGFTAKSLTLTFTASPGLTFSAINDGDPFFNTVSQPTFSDGLWTIIFSGIDEGHPGILSQDCSDGCFGAGADFVLGIDGVPPGGEISGDGTLGRTVPEPSTGVSLLLGMAGVALALRKMNLR
jgi:hypothetical protein